MSKPVLVDSTVLVKLALGTRGAEFAVNLFSRIEQGVERAVVTTSAIEEAARIVAIAAASGMLADNVRLEEVLSLLNKDAELRKSSYEAPMAIVQYLVRLSRTGRILLYSVSAEDVEEALRLSAETGLRISDSLTAVIARRLGVGKIATFSEELRRLPSFAYIP
ncbi:MAG: type II toxin-antitoxin system VapC family toxin [Thermoproteota archaeon]